VVDKERLYAQEFKDFLTFINDQGVGVFVSFLKPVGAIEGQYEKLINSDDLAYMAKLEKSHKVFTHLTPAFGLDLGCPANKGILTITAYGDIMPCQYMFISVGNIKQEPLRTLVQRGLGIKWFGEKVNTCPIAADPHFIKTYMEDRVFGKPLPVLWSKVFTDEDRTRRPFQEDL
jgi:MoaA/NifB/PqqE/SkfB family radical SAM enzyme